MRLLNIGCGKRYHQDWINLDKNQADPYIQQWDANKGLPFSDFYFDLVYHSHVLEHFEFNSAKCFLNECHRVLKKNGIIRIALPDLEQIVRCYLEKLQKSLEGDNNAAYDYDWIMLELYDQAVRETSGGKMADFINQKCIPNKNFIIHRCGNELFDLTSKTRKRKKKKDFSRSIKNIIYNFRENFIKTILGDEYEMLKIGRFRRSGENHKWMYDRYSLHKFLEESGFVNIVQKSADTSFFSDWKRFNLDTNTNGSIYKPDSFYMEALKP